MDYPGRIRRLQAALDDNRLDALLVTHLPNVRYLCGFTGSAGVLLVHRSQVIFFTDGRYRTQAREEVSDARIVIATKTPSLAATEMLAPAGARKTRLHVGIESQSVTLAQRQQLVAALTAKCRLVPAAPLIERLRMVKDEHEIRRIRAAVEFGAGLMPTLIESIRPGVREVDVAAAIEYKARCGGVDGMSFPTIIAAGKRSALVHGRASQARIPRRGFVVCDFGVILAGYCSDRTRTVHLGTPSPQARRAYHAVKEAGQAAIARVRPGASCGEIDAAARKILKKYGLARYLTHSTGHGLGLEIHEAPRLAAGQTQELEPGMVITIEPGVYIPGKQGVRIEDVVVVTRNGNEVLTPTDKELIQI